MSILDLPTEILEIILRDLDPLSLVSLYKAHPDIADRIDSTTRVWERTCRRYTPADALRAVVDQHLDDKLCFTPDKWSLICLKLAKPFLYVSQFLKPDQRLWNLSDERNERGFKFFASSIFTFGDSTFVDASSMCRLHPVKFHLDQAHKCIGRANSTRPYGNMAVPYPSLDDLARMRLIRYERSTELLYEELQIPAWHIKFGSIIRCFYRYGNLLILGTENGQLRLYTVESELPDSNDIPMTDVPTTPHPFATIQPDNSVTFDEPKTPSTWAVLNLKVELLFVVCTPCRPIRCLDVIDRNHVLSVVCSNRGQCVLRIDIPTEWHTESEFRNRAAYRL